MGGGVVPAPVSDKKGSLVGNFAVQEDKVVCKQSLLLRKIVIFNLNKQRCTKIVYLLNCACLFFIFSRRL